MSCYIYIFSNSKSLMPNAEKISAYFGTFTVKMFLLFFF